MKSSYGKYYSDKLINLLGLNRVTFKKLPPHTICANVAENIDYWRIKKDHKALNAYTRIDSSKGRRFVNCDDFEESITLGLVVRKKPIVITLHRKVEAPDHFCPLDFRERFVDIYLVTNEGDIQIETAAQLIREVKHGE